MHSSTEATFAAPVAIIGAGIGGLSLALALEQAGVPYQVYERNTTLSEVGAGITLWRNAVAALGSIGAWARVRDVAHLPPGGVIGLANGNVLTENDLSDHAEPTLWTLHRAELQSALYEQLPPSRVSFAQSFQSYQPLQDAVQLTFAETSPVTASLVIGADGLFSRVRAQMIGEESPRYSGYACFRAVCPKPPGWSGPCGEFWGKGDRFGVVELPKDRLYWFAVLNAPEEAEAPHDKKAAVAERFSHYAFGVPDTIQATDADAVLYHKLYDRRPIARFHDGRVCLLGDAAHPTTPNLGQGAAMAIESAVVLARCLSGGSTLERALSAYEQTRAPRTELITHRSHRIGQAAQLENGLLRALRNSLIRMTPKSTQRRQLQSLVDYDAGSVPLAI